jgi:hypothetical protein
MHHVRAEHRERDAALCPRGLVIGFARRQISFRRSEDGRVRRQYEAVAESERFANFDWREEVRKWLVIDRVYLKLYDGAPLIRQ